MNWAGISFTRARVLQVGTLLLLLVLGAVLPYVTLGYIDPASELVRPTERLLGAGDLLGGLDPTYLPGYSPALRSQLNLALNLAAAGPGIQQVASLVAAVACWGLFADEINKFFFWPLHLAGWILALGPVPLLIGLSMLRSAGVVVGLGPGWVPLALAGVVVLVSTFRARSRLDTYGGI